MTQARDANGRFTKSSNGSPTNNANGKAARNFKQEELIANTLLSRKEFIDQFLDPRRDINDECGYPNTASMTAHQFKDLYDREAVAARVVEVMPKESWKTAPMLIEDNDAGTKTVFEEAWDNLGRSVLFDDKSKYKDTEHNPIWEYLTRADVLSGIGSYGVILLGLDDGAELSEPIEESKGTERNLLFLRAFDEHLAHIASFDVDPNSVRFGRPNMYNLFFVDPDKEFTSQAEAPVRSAKVHWTRVVHLADSLGSSEVFGPPRMLTVLNQILNLRKLYGGSAEMYWRGAFPGLSIESQPQLQGDVEIDQVAARNAIEQYMNGLQRYLSIIGMNVKSLAPQVVDPTPQINVQLEAICIRMAIPKRIFLGSERGELASGQDDDTWNDRLMYRREEYLTPRVIVPFVDRLITLGVLPEPEQYSVSWPDLGNSSDDEKATVAVKWTEAMAKYVQSGAESIMDPMDFFTRILNMSQEEAEAVVEAAAAHIPDLVEREDMLSPAIPELGEGNGETQDDFNSVTGVS